MAHLHRWPRGGMPSSPFAQSRTLSSGRVFPGATAGRGFSPADDGTRARLVPKRGGANDSPACARAVSAPAQSRSHGVLVRRGARLSDRTATEARVRSPFSEVSVFQADPERWSGIRTRDPMINVICSFQLSYPRMVD